MFQIGIVLYFIFVAFLLILYAIVNRSNKSIESYKAKIKSLDDNKKINRTDITFEQRYGYDYDYIIVFKVWEERMKEKLSQYQLEHSMKNIIARLINGGLEYCCFYSALKGEIYCKIRCPPVKLQSEAYRIKYKLRLNPDRLRNKAQRGKEVNGKRIWNPINITDEFHVSNYKVYDYIYGKYDINPEYASLWVAYETIQEEETAVEKARRKKEDKDKYHVEEQALYKIVTARHKLSASQKFFAEEEEKRNKKVERNKIKLILSIMQAKTIDNGCGLDIAELKTRKCIKGSYALHNYKELVAIQEDMVRAWSWPKKASIEKVKDYFGEKVGLFFSFLSFYVTLLFVPAVFGFITYTDTLFHFTSKQTDNFTSHLTVPFTIFMILWTSFFQIYWKQTQATLSMEWGVHGFEKYEQARPQFQGIPAKSPVDGSDMLYFPPKEQVRRSLYSTVVLSMLCILVSSCFVAVFVLQYWLNYGMPRDDLALQEGLNFADLIASVGHSATIQILNFVYTEIAIKLNDQENHRTETQYEDGLISKIFSIQIVNSYSSVAWAAFFDRISAYYACPQSKYPDTCFQKTALMLATIFITRLFLYNISAVAIPLLKTRRRTLAYLENMLPGSKLSPLEQEDFKVEYDVMIGTIRDYSEIIIQLGYTTLFIPVFPASTVLSFVSGYVLIRIASFKLCQLHRRPWPKTSQDIGKLEVVVDIIATLTAISNCALLVFGSHMLSNYTWRTRWLIFFGVEHLLLAVKIITFQNVPHVPNDVEIQLDRQEFLVSKVLDNIKDEFEEEYISTSSNTELLVRDTDYDYPTADMKRIQAADSDKMGVDPPPGEGLVGDEEAPIHKIEYIFV